MNRALLGLVGVLTLAASVVAADAAPEPTQEPASSVVTTGNGQGSATEVELGLVPAAEKRRGLVGNGCIAPFKTVVFSGINLPRGGAFLHRVVPDRSGFNVVLRVEYPSLFRTINKFGPGHAESFTVRTPTTKVKGKVKISGVGGSFGCFVLRITP